MCYHIIFHLYDLHFVLLQLSHRWQIKPKYLQVSGAEQALESALQMVSRELGTEADYKIQARLYKLLLYEEGW